MNHVHRLVFNRCRGVVQAVSELARGGPGGGAGGGRGPRSRVGSAPRLRGSRLALAVALAAVGVVPAHASTITGPFTVTAPSDLGASVTLDGGTLSFVNTSSLTYAGSVTIGAGGGTINADGPLFYVPVIFSGAMSGGGALALNADGASGLIQFTGAAQSLGALSVDSGTAQVGDGTNPASLSVGSLGVGGTAEFDVQSGSVLSVSSAIDVASSATFGLNGELDLAAGGTIATQIAVNGFSVNGSVLSVAPGATLTLGSTGGFYGEGSLDVTGGGTVIDNGTGGPLGGTTVTAGTLEVGDAAHPTASLSGPVDVLASGTLRGHGTVSGDVTSSGTVMPGGSIGMLTVNGNYTQLPGGTLAIELTPNASTPGVGYDQLAVSGVATLDGTLAVTVDPGTYVAGSRYDLVHAGGGIVGQFASVTYAPAFAAYLVPNLQYAANDVYLSLDPTPLAFSSAQASADAAWIVDRSLFDALSGVALQADRGAWAHALGGDGRVDGVAVRDAGLLLGNTLATAGAWNIGAAASLLQTHAADGTQAVDGASYGLYGYGIYRQDALRVDVSAGGGALSRSLSRQLGATGLVAGGRSGGWFAGADIEARWHQALSGRAYAEPYAGAAWLHTRDSALTESGAGALDLHYAARSGDLGELRTGLRLGFDGLEHGQSRFSPWVSVGAVAAIGSRSVGQDVSLGGMTQTLSATAAPDVALETGAGVAMQGARGNWSVDLGFDGRYASGSHFGRVVLQGRWLW